MSNKISIFSELRFPEHLSLGAVGGPMFNTTINTTTSGCEQRNIVSLKARHKFNISPAIRDQSDLSILLTFFKIHKGKAVGFRFKDWADYKVSNELIAIGDGMTSTFQIKKTYKFGSSIDERIITKIVDGSVKLRVGSVNIHNFDVDNNNGVLKLHSPLEDGQPLYLDCEFDIPVRFDQDEVFINPEVSNKGSCDIYVVEILN
jgi:uncharacterized protein (TIGR02217 family)